MSVRCSPSLSCLAGGKIQRIESLQFTLLRVRVTAVFPCVLGIEVLFGRMGDALSAC